jgi:hypothetical protein
METPARLGFGTGGLGAGVDCRDDRPAAWMSAASGAAESLINAWRGRGVPLAAGPQHCRTQFPQALPMRFVQLERGL